jgi:hypothetical protein
MDGLDAIGGGEVSGEIRCEVPERDSIDGYLDSNVSSVLFVVVVGEVVWGISNLEAGSRSTSALGVGGELNESPNPELLDNPRPNLDVGLNAFCVGLGFVPNESLNPELVDP